MPAAPPPSAALRKDNTGYDLKQLFIGAEGTLGVVTRAVLELQPALAHHRTLFAALTGLDRATDLYGLARSIDAGGLTAFELVPEMGVAAAVDVLGITRPIDTRAEWYLMARFSGSEPVADTVTRFLSAAADRGWVADAVVAETAAQEANLWLLRDELPPEILIDSKGAKFDAAVPIDRIPEFQRGVEAVAARVCGPEAVVFSFGHLGDGNLHVYVLPSLEHLLRAVKAALDPTDLFNPGKGAQAIAHSTRPD